MTGLHMSGAGNDFVVVDARGCDTDLAALAVKACAITGADGFLALDSSKIADFRLHFYNSDGLRGEMCGNGARCICRYAYEQGITGESMTIQTDAGLVHGKRINEDTYRVRLNNPSVLELNYLNNIAYVELGNPGIPHALLEIPGLRWEDRELLRPMAEKIRHDPIFPKGVNVNFYTWLGENTVRILTYERGVGDYTLACGTGSGSLAALLWKTGQITDSLTAENPGGTLHLNISGTVSIHALHLEGPTEIIAQISL